MENPWSDSIVKLGGLSSLYPYIDAEDSEYEETEFVSKLKNISVLRAKVDKSRYDQEEIHFLNENQYILDRALLETTYTQTKEFNSYISLLLENSRILSAKLQEPFTSDHIIVEVEHQADFVEFIYTLPDTIRKLTSIMQLLHKSDEFSTINESTMKQLHEVSCSVAKLQREYTTLVAIGQSINELYELEVSKH